MAGTGIQIQVGLTPNPELLIQYRFIMPASQGGSLASWAHKPLFWGQYAGYASCLCSCSQPAPFSRAFCFILSYNCEALSGSPPAAACPTLSPSRGNSEARMCAEWMNWIARIPRLTKGKSARKGNLCLASHAEARNPLSLF